MKKLKYILGSIFIGFTFTGCMFQPSISSISEEEAFKYEKQYLAEYENFKQQNKDFEDPFKWIQPKNKKEECKVYVGIDSKNDKTTKSDYSLYWDGKCKNGYAYGLGREIEKTTFTDLQQIGIYENGKAVDYCTITSPLEGWNVDGECSYSKDKANHFVKTLIVDKLYDFDINYQVGTYGTNSSPEMLIFTSPFNENIRYTKAYPNFAYIIDDFTKNEFENINFWFNTLTLQNGIPIANGYEFAITKNGQINGAEILHEKIVKKVQLPKYYIDNANSILNEIKKEANIALEVQKKALIIKEKYKKQICKDSVKVDFMDNSEYKEICNEDKKIAELKIKVDEKLAQIEQQKQAKRNQINQQQLIQAQQAQAIAAQRQAQAAENANTQQSLQNMNNNYQMQQHNYQMQNLNNNLNNINRNLNQKNGRYYNNR